MRLRVRKGSSRCCRSEILREAVESYAPYLQASGEMHVPHGHRIAPQPRCAAPRRLPRFRPPQHRADVDPGAQGAFFIHASNHFRGQEPELARRAKEAAYRAPSSFRRWLAGWSVQSGREPSATGSATNATRPTATTRTWRRLSSAVSNGLNLPFTEPSGRREASLFLEHDPAYRALLVSGLTNSLLTKLAVCQVAAAFGCAGPAALNASQFTDESVLFPSKADVESGGTVHLPRASLSG